MDLKLSHGTKKQYPTETLIFEEGDPSDFMYVLISGKVVIYKKVIQRANRVMHILEAGEYFGEMALLTGDRRSATAKTIADSDVIQIDKTEFQKLVREVPEFGINLMRQMSERLSKTSETLIYNELELALSQRKPTRPQETYPGKILFVVTGSFKMEDKNEVLKTVNTLKWTDDIDVITSLFRPGKVEESIVFVVAVEDLKTLLNVISCFNNLVKWDYSPVLPTNTTEEIT